MNSKSDKTNLLARARIICGNIKSNLDNLKKTGMRKSCFTMVAGYDDPKKGEDIIITTRDSRTEDFDRLFDQAVSLSPDYISVRIFQGEGISANEVPDSKNTIRITNRKAEKPPTGKAGKKTLQGPAEPQQPQFNPSQQEELKLMRVEFECNMKLQNLEAEHNQKTRDHKNELEDLKKKLISVEQSNEEQEKYIAELESERKSTEEKQIGSAKTLIQGGLLALGQIAAKDPTGKMLGFIPNHILMGLSGTEPETQIAASSNGRSVPINQIAEFLQSLPQEDFDKAFSIFGFMYNNPGQNISMLVDLIQSPSQSPSANPVSH